MSVSKEWIDSIVNNGMEIDDVWYLIQKLSKRYDFIASILSRGDVEEYFFEFYGRQMTDAEFRQFTNGHVWTEGWFDEACRDGFDRVVNDFELCEFSEDGEL